MVTNRDVTSAVAFSLEGEMLRLRTPVRSKMCPHHLAVRPHARSAEGGDPALPELPSGWLVTAGGLHVLPAANCVESENSTRVRRRIVASCAGPSCPRWEARVSWGPRTPTKSSFPALGWTVPSVLARGFCSTPFCPRPPRRAAGRWPRHPPWSVTRLPTRGRGGGGGQAGFPLGSVAEQVFHLTRRHLALKRISCQRSRLVGCRSAETTLGRVLASPPVCASARLCPPCSPVGCSQLVVAEASEAPTLCPAICAWFCSSSGVHVFGVVPQS
ncbi:Filamin-B [Varanus komodoensis]|nr:Filamin-B [Varanus komodoensis]